MKNQLNTLSANQVKLLKKVIKQDIQFLEFSFDEGHRPQNILDDLEDLKYMLGQLKRMKGT
jgi:hypothetical protein